MIRRVVCALAIGGIGILVLGWAAGLGWRTPLVPQQRIVLPAHDFRVVMGAGVEDGEALRVAAVGDDGDALQSIALDHLRAEDFPLLRYRFDGFPRTLELSLIFRRADAPADVQAVTIPWPGKGWTTLDLRGVPGWRGEIVELGFSEYATPQIVPQSVAFRPFRFDGAQLWSPSWRGGLAALGTAWFGYTPWALLSVSALGPALETAKTPPLLPYLVVAVVLGLAAAALVLRWRRPRLLRAAVIAAASTWAALDLAWLSDLHAKHRLTEHLYVGKPWPDRARLVPDQDTEAAAEQIKAYLATQPPVHHLLVASDSTYTKLRLLYLLLPLNVAPLALAGEAPLPRDALLLLYASDTWRYDEGRGLLVAGNRTIPALPLYESGAARLYRLRSTPP
jgi:hypothetical protein